MFKNLPTASVETYNFDAIFVCNGHNSVPLVPTFEGADEFKGKQIHSHFFRRADEFKGKKVLIIGAGPTGIDLTLSISNVAKKLLFSHHTHSQQAVPENVHKKARVKRFTENGVIFEDGDSEEEITDVIYCTGNCDVPNPNKNFDLLNFLIFVSPNLGFKFTMPFVGSDSGICISDNYVSPLYKNCINAKHPTMAVFGYVLQSAFSQILDVQVCVCPVQLRT